jgi:hypothetical protein
LGGGGGREKSFQARGHDRTVTSAHNYFLPNIRRANKVIDRHQVKNKKSKLRATEMDYHDSILNKDKDFSGRW